MTLCLKRKLTILRPVDRVLILLLSAMDVDRLDLVFDFGRRVVSIIRR